MVALSSEGITQQMAQIVKAYNQKDYNLSVRLLQDIVAKNPDCEEAHKKLAFIWMRTDTPQAAVPHIESLLALNPKDADIWRLKGYYHKNRAEWAVALYAFKNTLESGGEPEIVLLEILKMHRNLDDNLSALEASEQLLKLNPDSVEFRLNYAQILTKIDRKTEAFEQYDTLVKQSNATLREDILEEWYGLSVVLRRNKESHKKLHKLYLSHPKNTTLLRLYAGTCKTDGDLERALFLLLEAQRLDPKNSKINRSLGELHRILGNIEQSDNYLRSSLDYDPLNTITLASRGRVHHYIYGDDAFKQLSFAATHIDKLPKKEQALLHYALGKAYDDVGETATAFEHFEVGGALHSSGKHERELAGLKRNLSQIKKYVTKEAIETFTDPGCRSERPIFIVGMPHSGTTLMEQVLSSIKGVYGAGELPCVAEALDQMEVNGYKIKSSDKNNIETLSTAERGESYLNKVSQLTTNKSQRIIDKMPTNFIFTGFLHLILPNASIIHSRRHPIETCLSAYRIHFAQGQYWSDDLRTMGRYYRLYSELMRHWHTVLPEGSILDVRYEDMVTDPEGQSRRIIEHIGMPWDPNCLNFHRSKQPVCTMNHWQKYEPYLGPLLDEIGDIVEVYEA